MAKKHIDADLLREKIVCEIEQWKEKTANHYTIEAEARWSEANYILGIFDSLQQEQQEVDLEEEIERFLGSEESTSYTNAGGYVVAFKDTVKIARHFYELGKNSK